MRPEPYDTKMNNRLTECPHARRKAAGDETYTMCNLADKWCLLEGNNECEEYDNYLKELASE